MKNDTFNHTGHTVTSKAVYLGDFVPPDSDHLITAAIDRQTTATRECAERIKDLTKAIRDVGAGIVEAMGANEIK